MKLDCVSVVGAQLQYLGDKKTLALQPKFAKEFGKIMRLQPRRRKLRSTVQYAATLMKDMTLTMSRPTFVRLLLATESLRQKGITGLFPQELRFMASMPMSQLTNENASVLITAMDMMEENCETNQDQCTKVNGRA